MPSVTKRIEAAADVAAHTVTVQAARATMRADRMGGN